jgi:hypothetical protein
VSAGKSFPPSVDRRESRRRAALVAAYREGVGLAAVAMIRSSAGIHITAAGNGGDGLLAPGDAVEAQWWCRRSVDAARVAAAATARLRRGESKDGAPNPSAASLSLLPGNISAAFLLAERAIAAAAKRCNVTLYSDEETSAAAMAIIVRVDAEIERLQYAGDLKSVNRSYRIYRTEAAARGEKVLRYAEWISKYKEKLVRELAAALRYS